MFGDVRVAVGYEEDIMWLERKLHAKDDIASEIVGPGTDKKQVTVLNKATYESDPHAELMMEFKVDACQAIIAVRCKNSEQLEKTSW